MGVSDAPLARGGPRGPREVEAHGPRSAATGPAGRGEGWSPATAAEAQGGSRATAYEWRRRRREEGDCLKAAGSVSDHLACLGENPDRRASRSSRCSSHGSPRPSGWSPSPEPPPSRSWSSQRRCYCSSASPEPDAASCSSKWLRPATPLRTAPQIRATGSATTIQTNTSAATCNCVPLKCHQPAGHERNRPHGRKGYGLRATTPRATSSRACSRPRTPSSEPGTW
jgi:hypothetical protein